MANARTKTSNWIYRVSLSLLVLGTIRHGQFMYDQFPQAADDASDAVYWTALLAIMGGTISLAVAVVAMLFRSGAVVWLLGLQFVLMCITLGPSMFFAQSFGPVAIGITLIVIALALGTLLFTYLIRREEIRSL